MVDQTCVGTSYADDAIYYYHRPAIDDIHGYGPVLLAGAEMIRLMKNDHFKITGGPARRLCSLARNDFTKNFFAYLPAGPGDAKNCWKNQRLLAAIVSAQRYNAPQRGKR